MSSNQHVLGAKREMVRSGSAHWALYVAGALSLEAGIVHLFEAPEHWLFWWGYGVFFVATGLAQALFSILVVWRPGPLLFLIGIALNFSMIVIYAISRTSGIPFLGPHAWQAEWPGQLDVLATAAEVGLVFLLVASLDGTFRRITINALFFVSAFLWLLRISGVLTEPF